MVSTGLGSTGWLKSLLTGAVAIAQSASSVLARQAAGDPVARGGIAGTGDRRGRLRVKSEFAWEADQLFYPVGEPFPARTTGASLVFGRITLEAPLTLESRMAENGVIFSDGMEKDFLEFNSGTRAVIGIAERKGLRVA
jgi:hypothetical protein